jgi:CheY-like chemotaxis protein
MSSQGKKILVIDDNFGILFVMRRALELKGYQVEVLNSFSTIIEIEEISPDLIFLDISLPTNDGYVISREIKNSKKTKDIPIVILTGYSDAEAIRSEMGAEDILSKPFGLLNLWKVVEKHTGIQQILNSDK